MGKIREACQRLPALYSTEPKALEVSCIKIFNPSGSGTWYLSEYDSESDVCFGLCCINEPELGYVLAKDLESITTNLGLKLEVDAHWSGTLENAMRIEER